MAISRIVREVLALCRGAPAPEHHNPAARIEAEAAAWIVRLETNPTPELREEFLAWRKSDERNHLACSRLEIAWQRTGLLENIPPVADDFVVETRDSRPATDASARASSVPRSLRWLVAPGVPVVVMVAMGALVVLSESGKTISNDAYATEYVRLKDGTSVALAPESELRVRFSSTTRVIELGRGAARFTVAHERRPFEVRVGGVVAMAKGTVFSARLDKRDDSVIAVSEGRVALTRLSNLRNIARDDLPADVPILVAGETAVASPERFRVEPSPKRKLRFRRTPLSDAVRELNLFNARQVRIIDPSLGSTKFSGVYAPTDLDDFIEAMAPYHIRVAFDGTEILLFQ
jgi:transmembrane sensor